MIEDINTMIIYAERYAINRSSYANGDMADLVIKYIPQLTRKNRLVLVRDIEENFKNIPYPDQKIQWREALQKLKESLEMGL